MDAEAEAEAGSWEAIVESWEVIAKSWEVIAESAELIAGSAEVIAGGRCARVGKTFGDFVGTGGDSGSGASDRAGALHGCAGTHEAFCGGAE